MAKHHITVIDFARRPDPAAVAARAMKEAKDDAAYEAARIEFERSQPTSFEGLAAILAAVVEVLEAESDGDDALTDAGSQLRRALSYVRAH